MPAKLDFVTTVRLRVDGDVVRDPRRFDEAVATELDAVRRDLEAAIRSERQSWLDAHG